MSIPALTPLEVQIYPITQLSRVRDLFHPRPQYSSLCSRFLFVITYRPSKMPALATMPTPVQTPMRYTSVRYVLEMKEIVSSRSGARIPRPPGISGTSSGPTVSKVCVGRMLSPNEELKGFMAAKRGLVDTGSRVAATRNRLIWWLSEKMFKNSRGPKTSRGSNEGNRTTPKLVGADSRKNTVRVKDFTELGKMRTRAILDRVRKHTS